MTKGGLKACTTTKNLEQFQLRSNYEDFESEPPWLILWKPASIGVRQNTITQQLDLSISHLLTDLIINIDEVAKAQPINPRKDPRILKYADQR
jgi:hypothetical protein